MNSTDFEWDEHNVNHIAKHDVQPEDAEYVLFSDALEIDFNSEIDGERRWT